MSPRAVVAVVVAAVAGTGLLAFGLVSRSPSLRTGANEFVHGRTGDAAHNSPSVAADPRRPSTIVVANRIDGPVFGCALATSSDDGVTWRPVDLPPGMAVANCFWPRVAFAPDGTLLVLYTILGGPNVLPVTVWLQRFVDLRPAGSPVQVAGDLAFYARLAVHGSGVWVTWVQAGPATADNQLGLALGENPVVVARSDDGGRSFAAPVRVSEPDQRIIQPTVLAGPDGTVVVGALDLADDILNYTAAHDGQTPPDPALRWRVVAWTSADRGDSFGPPAVVAADLAVPQLIIADLGPTPGFALDESRDRVYATWDAGRGSARDAFVAWSDDGGRRWSAPVRVGPTAGSQVLPAVSVAGDGRVDVVLYDRSGDSADILTEAVVASSWDGGETFRSTTVSDTSFDSRIGLGAQQGVPLLGDNLAVLSRAEGPLAFWADTGRGALVTNVQDLAVAVVEADAGRQRYVPALVAGALAWVTAAVILVAARRRGGRRPNQLAA